MLERRALQLAGMKDTSQVRERKVAGYRRSSGVLGCRYRRKNQRFCCIYPPRPTAPCFVSLTNSRYLEKIRDVSPHNNSCVVVGVCQHGDWDNFRNGTLDGTPFAYPPGGGWVPPPQGLFCADYVSPMLPVGDFDLQRL